MENKRVNPDTIVERARAARAYINNSRGHPDHIEALELTAFLDIFHPNISRDKQRKLVNSIRNRET